MPHTHTRIRANLACLALVLGGLGVLATGADHLEEYAANHFNSVPTIGTLFLLNFIAATVIGLGLLLPLARLAGSTRETLRGLLALGGIGLAASSLIGLWVSETSSVFGFSDHGLRPAIVAAIVVEATAIVSLIAYVALAPVHLRRAHPAGQMSHS